MRQTAMRNACATLAVVSLMTACGSSTPAVVDAGPPPCDAPCQDRTAVRSVREMMKLIYNLTLQGKPVGEQNHAISCPKGGKAFIYGTAASNADQGTTAVKLTYEAEACGYSQRDNDADETYDVVLTGKIVQEGVLAVQPSSSTALVMKAERVTITGTIREPALPYRAEACKLDMTQDGSRLTAALCGRTVGLNL